MQRWFSMLAQAVSAHDTDRGRGSHFRMWENPLGAGDRPASDFPAVCLALGAACAHPVAGAHWRALKSSQSLEPEEVVVQEGSSLPF